MPTSTRQYRAVLALVATALVCATVTVVLAAPAVWLGLACERLTEGRALLAEAEGTVWHGNAIVVLAGTGSATRTRLPGRIYWEVSLPALLGARLDAVIRADIAPAQAIRLQIDRHGAARISPGSILFPARLLTGLGAPWNTIKPGGTLALEWGAWASDDASVSPGAVRLVWTNAASAVCQVDPLGTYRLTIAGWNSGSAVHLDTLSGPMELSGDGTIGGPSLIRFRAKARVRDGTDERIANQVASVVALLGPRDGDGAALQIGM